MIVDSPGVGESDVMSEFVLSYLPRAFCFMYVISSVNAGGIQEDRVCKRISFRTLQVISGLNGLFSDILKHGVCPYNLMIITRFLSYHKFSSLQ